MKKVIVTGSTGFVGVNLVKFLANQGIGVISIVRNEMSNVNEIKDLNNVRLVLCSLSNIRNLHNVIKDRDIDTIFHLAWDGANGSKRGDVNLQLENVKAVCDIVKVSKKLGCKKLICIGTISEMLTENFENLKEKPVQLIYSLAKKYARMMLEVESEKHNLQHIWIQLGNVFGAGNRTGNLISYTLEEFSKGNVPSYSKAEQEIDFIHIYDAVHAIYLLACKKNNYKTYYVGNGRSEKLKKFLNEIVMIYGNGAKINIGARNDDGLRYKKEWYDISKLVEDTGFKPKYSFEDGIRDTIEKEVK